MKQKITIYTTPTCHYCHLAKAYFEENAIEYTAHDVSQDAEKREEMIEKSGQMGVPVIEIGETIIIGFDKPKIESLLSGAEVAKAA